MALSTLRKILIPGLISFALSACSTWMGEREEILPGERISILQHSRSLVPDPSVQGQQIVLPAPFVTPNWPQSGGYANHAMHHIELGNTLKRAWRRDIGAGASDEERFTGSPVVAAGRVFTLDAFGEVRAFGLGSGEHLWDTDLIPEDEDDGHFGGGLAVDHGAVFVTTGFGQVIALNMTDGKVLWRKQLSGPIRAAPTVRGHRVFAITADNKLYVLAARNGEELWVHEAISETASMLGNGSAAVDSGIVIAPFSSGELVALKVENGQPLWSISLAASRRSDPVAALADIRGNPVIDRGMVFAISNSGQFVAIDLKTGRRVWERKIGSLEAPWVAGDYIFTLTNDSELTALSRKNGSIYWVTSLPRFEDPDDRQDPIFWTGPILASDRLIIAGSHGEALAISPYNGKYLGRIDMPDAVTVPPIVASRTLFFLADDATLSAYR